MTYLRNFGKPKRVLPDSPDAVPAAKKPKKEFKQYPQTSEIISIPAGEDDTSNSRNQKILLSEERKSNPNKHTLSVLMDRTFAFRRIDIMKKPCHIYDTLKLYPSLKRLDQVQLSSFIYSSHLCYSYQIQAEIKRIFPEKNLSTIETTTKWEELVPKIHKLAEIESNPDIETWLDDSESCVGE